MEIAEAIVEIAILLKQRNNDQVVVTGLLPRGMYPSAMRDEIVCVNNDLKMLLHKRGTKALYIPPENNWLHPDGKLNLKVFFISTYLF